MSSRFLLFVLFSLFCAAAFAYDAEDKIYFSKGNIPVLLTVPHDGGETLGWIGVRVKGTVVRDTGTQELAERTADLLEKKLGGRPYLVVAKFSRKYLDANRPENEAQEAEETLPAYRAYHGKISSFVDEITSKYPEGSIMIDVHGQSDEPGVVFIGTRNGTTVKSMLNKYGKEALRGDNSIAGVLQASGLEVFPGVGDMDTKEDRRFNGGYTVHTYGSQRKNGMDAIQIEFGKKARENSDLAKLFSDAIMVYSKKYIPFFGKP